MTPLTYDPRLNDDDNNPVLIVELLTAILTDMDARPWAWTPPPPPSVRPVVVEPPDPRRVRAALAAYPDFDPSDAYAS